MYVDGVVKQIMFTVVDCPSGDNTLLGRSWIHTMGPVPSTSPGDKVLRRKLSGIDIRRTPRDHLLTNDTRGGYGDRLKGVELQTRRNFHKSPRKRSREIMDAETGEKTKNWKRSIPNSEDPIYGNNDDVVKIPPTRSVEEGFIMNLTSPTNSNSLQRFLGKVGSFNRSVFFLAEKLLSFTIGMLVNDGDPEKEAALV